MQKQTLPTRPQLAQGLRGFLQTFSVASPGAFPLLPSLHLGERGYNRQMVLFRYCSGWKMVLEQSDNELDCFLFNVVRPSEISAWSLSPECHNAWARRSHDYPCISGQATVKRSYPVHWAIVPDGSGKPSVGMPSMYSLFAVSLQISSL